MGTSFQVAQRYAHPGGSRPSATVIAAALAAYAALICLRMPQVVLKGRFWAEEGKYFFARAWDQPAWRALWEPLGGYLNLVANAATIIARHISSLSLAPYVTIVIGLAFQLLPPLIILTARDRWLQSPLIRGAALALLLFLPASEEVALQTLHCQFELTLAAGLVLALETGSGTGEYWRRGVLGLAPLSGPGVAALIPLFAARTYLDRSRLRSIQFVILIVGVCVQYFGFYEAVAGRAYSLHLVLLTATIALKHVAVPFLGIEPALRWKQVILARLAAGELPWLALALPPVLLALLAYVLCRRDSWPVGLWLLLGSLATGGLAYFGAIGGGLSLIDVLGNQRYAFVPQSLIELSVLTLCASPSLTVRRVAMSAVAWLVCVGILNFWDVSQFIANGPAWRPQLAGWRSGTTNTLSIWPAGWTMTLHNP